MPKPEKTEAHEPQAAPVPPAALDAEGSAAAETKTVEEWATAKKMLPAMLTTGGRMDVPGAAPGQVIARVSLRRSDLVAPRVNPRYRLFAAAKVMHQWPEGLRLTEAKFDEAVIAADTGTPDKPIAHR